MYEKYELPIRFTEEQRKKYAEWGIKKGKVLMPMAAVTIGIDLLTVLWVVGRVWLIRESDPICFRSFARTMESGKFPVRLRLS